MSTPETASPPASPAPPTSALATSAPATSPPATSPKRVRRCNADYRWTVKKVEAFLRALGRCGVVAEAAREVGMGRQSAYRLKARLADPRFQNAFELARREGRIAREAAREEARRARAASAWGEPGLAAFAHLRGDDPRAQGNARVAQGDARGAQGDARRAQGYAPAARRPVRGVRGDASAGHGDAFAAQGDGSRRKAPF